MLLTFVVSEGALHFGELQVAVLALFGLIAVALAAMFVTVARMSRADVPLEQVQRVGYRLRRGWLVFLVALGVGTVFTSLFFLPYSGGTSKRTTVKVSSGQFYWSLTPNTVRPGTRVRFEVSSIDVNHGFGLYDPDEKLIGSVQAMPGYTNKLDVTLNETGTYRVACLEFCGARHHLMATNLKVE